jgi:hypothetical protein
VILTVPTKVIRSLNTIPAAIRDKLPPRWSIHSLLALDLALNQAPAPWLAVLPSLDELRGCMPLLWPAELQAFLPLPVASLVNTQQAKIESEWVNIKKLFPSLDYDDYLRAWLLINTRTFYHSTPETETYVWEERLALLPVADLLNHADKGCQVLFSDQEYSITTDRTYAVGEEICNAYGEHSNDFLLGEYGFILAQNPWDVVSIDDAILGSLSQQQRLVLKGENLLENFTISHQEGPCHRTKRAMQFLSSSSGLRDGKKSSARVDEAQNEVLVGFLNSYTDTITHTINNVNQLDVGEEQQKELLISRWQQIKALIQLTIQQLQSRA